MSDQNANTVPTGAPHQPEPGLGHIGVRIGVLIALFAAAGLVFTATLVRLPELQAAFGLDYSALGLVLLAPAVAGLMTAPWMPRLTARLGGLRTAGLATAAWGLAGLPIAWTAPNVWLLVPALAVWGAMFVAVDIAVNVTMAGIARAAGRSLMSRLHAGYSAAGAVGALSGGAAAQAGVPLFTQFVVAAALFTAVAATALVCAALLDALDRQTSASTIADGADAEPDPAPSGSGPAAGGTLFSRWWPLVAICLCALMAEGSVANWSAVGLTGLGAQPLLAGAGLAAFSAAMFVGRMSGDAIIDRLGHVGAIRTGTAFAALGGGAGLGAAHLLGDPLLGVAGFAAFGLGLSVAFPATLALAGSRAADSERASAIALTTSGGYIGVSVGPPLIGAIAQFTSVSAALLTLPALTALALLLSTLRVPRTKRPALRSAPLAAATRPGADDTVPAVASEDWSRTFAPRHQRRRPAPATVALVAVVAVLGTLLWTGQFDTLLPGGGASASAPSTSSSTYSAGAPQQAPEPAGAGRSAGAPSTLPPTSSAIPSVAAVIPTAATPGYVEVTPDGRQAWVAHREQGIISVLDLTLGTIVTTIPSVAGPPQFITFCPPGTPGAGRAYVSIYTMRNGVPDDSAPHVVSVIDQATLTPVGDPVPVGRRPYASSCSPDGTTLAVPSHDDARLDLVDTATATLRTSIPVAPYPHWAAHDRRGSIWLANHDSNAVTRVDARTLSIGEDDVVPDVGISPHAVAVNPDSTRVAVVSFDSDELRLFDTDTGTVLQTYPVGRSPQDVAWTADGARLLTTDVEDDRVSVVDAATGQITAALTPPVGQPGTWDGPTSIAVTPDGTTAVVTLLNTGAVAVLDLTAP